MRRISRARNGERGSQVVELAIALPVLVLLAFLVSEVSALVRVHQVINNAAREGARVSVLQNSQGHPAWAQDAALAYVNTYVPTACAPGTLNAVADQNVGLTVGGISSTASMVTVTCNYRWVTFKGDALPWLSIPATIPLKGTATFRNFY